MTWEDANAASLLYHAPDNFVNTLNKAQLAKFRIWV